MKSKKPEFGGQDGGKGVGEQISVFSERVFLDSACAGYQFPASHHQIHPLLPAPTKGDEPLQSLPWPAGTGLLC